MVMLETLYEFHMGILYPVVILLMAAAAEIGHQIGWRMRRTNPEHSDLGTLTGAALGLLALLLAFSFSIALSRYEARRALVLEEANAIGSTANFALMLPVSAQQPTLKLLREYTVVRAGLGIPFDPAKFQQDISRSLDLQARLWQQAVAVTAADPQSLPAYRFVASLNEMNNIHERRLTALRFHIPAAVVFTLEGVALVAMGFAGYNAGITGTRRIFPTLIMAITVGTLIVLVIDLDRPSRGLIQVPVQPLIDAANSIPP
nr:hypothetical protein [uncultured Rhodopila sp.]